MPNDVFVEPAAIFALDNVLNGLRVSRESTHNIRHEKSIRQLPSRDALQFVLDSLSVALFPTHYGHLDLSRKSVDDYVSDALKVALPLLTQQVQRDLSFARAGTSISDKDIVEEATRIVQNFAGQLPDIRAQLVDDLHAAYLGDPAATSYPEILLGYPGMAAVLYYRLARPLYRLGATLSARLIGHMAHSRTAIDIHPGADIGRSFFIDHGTGVVIGETAVIGNHVRLYQAVTLGAKSFEVDENGGLVKGLPRHPVVEDDVVIYAGATILGRVVIGRGSVIGGNVWLTQSVPPGSNITQALTRIG